MPGGTGPKTANNPSVNQTGFKNGPGQNPDLRGLPVWSRRYRYVLEGNTTTRDWPRPAAFLVTARLEEPPDGARIAVAGLVIQRQRSGTAKWVIFLTLEDETGIVNIIVWRKMHDRFRRAVTGGRLLRVTGRLQRAHSVSHVIAEEIKDIPGMLDLLLAPAGSAPLREPG